MKPANQESSGSDPASRGGTTGWIIGGSLVALAAALYFGLYLIPQGGISTPATETKAVLYVKQLVHGCRAYASDHEGVYPPNIEALYPDYIDVPEVFLTEDSGGKEIPLRYYPGLTESSDPDVILIEHPVPYRGNRIVGTVGGLILRVPID